MDEIGPTPDEGQLLEDMEFSDDEEVDPPDEPPPEGLYARVSAQLTCQHRSIETSATMLLVEVPGLRKRS